ncbi:DUF6875 domain-containing protein [Lentzea sp. NPDC054927]
MAGHYPRPDEPLANKQGNLNQAFRTVSDLQQHLHGDASNVVDSAAKWIKDYISKEIPGKEHLGPICPWASTATRLDTIHLRLHNEGDDPSTIAKSTEDAINAFDLLLPQSGPGRLHHITGILFLLATRRIYAQLEQQQETFKTLALKKGLMLGLFHQERTRRSLTHSGELTLRSPVPMILVRNLLPQDRRIFASLELSPETREFRLEEFDKWLTRRRS